MNTRQGKSISLKKTQGTYDLTAPISLLETREISQIPSYRDRLFLKFGIGLLVSNRVTYRVTPKKLGALGELWQQEVLIIFFGVTLYMWNYAKRGNTVLLDLTLDCLTWRLTAWPDLLLKLLLFTAPGIPDTLKWLSTCFRIKPRRDHSSRRNTIFMWHLVHQTW